MASTATSSLFLLLLLLAKIFPCDLQGHATHTRSDHLHTHSPMFGFCSCHPPACFLVKGWRRTQFRKCRRAHIRWLVRDNVGVIIVSFLFFFCLNFVSLLRFSSSSSSFSFVRLCFVFLPKLFVFAFYHLINTLHVITFWVTKAEVWEKSLEPSDIFVLFLLANELLFWSLVFFWSLCILRSLACTKKGRYLGSSISMNSLISDPSKNSVHVCLCVAH